MCVRGCVGAWVRGCVGAWVRGCVLACIYMCVCVCIEISQYLHQVNICEVYVFETEYVCPLATVLEYYSSSKPFSLIEAIVMI